MATIRRAAAVLLLLTGVHALVLAFSKFIIWEEMLSYPWLVSAGLAPYRDIILLYPPGLFSVLLPAYRLLGYTVSSLQTIGYGYFFATDVLLFILSYRLFRSLRAAAAALAFYILWFPVFEGKTLWFETMAAPFLLLSVYHFSRYLAGDRKSLWKSGAWMAATLFFKQTFLYVLAAEALFVLFNNRLSVRESLRDLPHLFLPPAVGQLAALAFFTLSGAGAGYLHLTWVYPITSLSRDASFALAPKIHDLLHVFPAYGFVMVPAGVVFVCTPARRSRVLFWLCAAGASALTAWPRFGYFHLQPSLLILSVGAGGVIHAVRLLRGKSWQKILPISAGAVFALLTYRSQAYYYVLRRPLTPGSDPALLARIAATVPVMTKNGDFYSLENSHLFHFLANKKPVVLPWNEQFPWQADPVLENRILSSLAKSNVPYVVYRPSSAADTSFAAVPAPEPVKTYIRLTYRLLSCDSSVFVCMLVRKDKVL